MHERPHGTGGITRRETAEQVLASGVAVAGMATALAVTPHLPTRWRQGSEASGSLKPVAWSDKPLASMASMAMVCFQMRRLGAGKYPALGVGPAFALAADQLVARRALRRYSRWLGSRPPGGTRTSV